MAKTLSGINVSGHSHQNSNALLLYKVGPVLVCSPSLVVEAVVLPPALTVPPGTSPSVPGVFKSMYGMVRVVDLRVRFGVDAVDIKTPGRIIIAEVTGGYAGFWVDEIEDVIEFPEKGWSKLPAHVPKEVFSRALIRDDGIRLYAELENLDKFSSTGYLRTHIENIKSLIDKNKSTESSAKIKFDSSELISKAATSISTNSTSDVSSFVKPASVSTLPSSKNLTTESVKKAPFKNKAVLNDGSDSKGIIKGDKEVCVASKFKKSKKILHEKKLGAVKTASRFDVKVSNKSSLEASNQSIKRAPEKQIKPGNIQQGVAAHEPITKSIGFESVHQTDKVDAKDELENDNSLLWLSVSLLVVLGLSIYLIGFMWSADSSSSVAEATKKHEIPSYKNSESVHLYEDSKSEFSLADSVDDLESNKIKHLKSNDDLVIEINDFEGAEQAAIYVSTKDSSNENKLIAEVDKIEDDDTLSQVIEDVRHARHKENADDLIAQIEVEAPDDVSGINAQLVAEQVAVIESAEVKDVAGVIKKDAINSNTEELIQTTRVVHIVISGDTLWHIAKRYVNNPWKYPELARLSKIKNPDLIYPGQKVIIIRRYKE